jgi:hypothetical protein
MNYRFYSAALVTSLCTLLIGCDASSPTSSAAGDKGDSSSTKQSAVTSAASTYSPSDLAGIKITTAGVRDVNGQCVVDLKVANQGKINLSAKSAVGKPVRLSWRFAGEHQDMMHGWDPRKDLPADIPPNGSITVEIPVGPIAATKGRTLEVSIVQEGVFWLHNHGFAPVRIPLNP